MKAVSSATLLRVYLMSDIVELPGAIFSVEVLQSPINTDLDQVTVYICASNLRPLGVLNGDWVCLFYSFVFPHSM